MELKKVQKWIEAINTYYAFALLLYATALYLASHSHLFMWVLIIATPILAGWSGFLLKAYVDRIYNRHGFRILEDAVTYEIAYKHKYLLHFKTKLKGAADHLMSYPVSYQWTGSGQPAVPELTAKGQQLLALVHRRADKNGLAKVAPYVFTTSAQGDWHYWFIAFNPPVNKGDIVEIKYSQEFIDTKGIAKPCLYHFVRTPIKRLELNVKFSKNDLPVTVRGSYFKPSDPRRPYQSADVRYDPDKQWATWVIERPKKGYCYRIDWQ